MSFADYRELYRQKLTTADEAVKIIKSGDWVDYGFCAIHPRVLDEALARRAPELEDVKVRGGISLWKPAIFDIEDPARHIIFNSHHMSGVERHYIASGAGFYEPMRYSELPRYYYDHITPPDVAMFQVTPMDSHGYFNFGLSASHVRAVCEKAKVVIVEVNENMPRCLGGFDNTIHISEVDMVVEGRNDPMGIQPSGEADDVDKAVARLIVEQIPDGACLQLGIGGMPNTVGAMLCQSDLKDLGVHTEMYVDAYVDLAMAGKVTCARKNIDRGRQVYAFAAGTQKLTDTGDDGDSQGESEAHAKAVHRRGQRPVFAGEGFRAGKYYAVNHYQRYKHAQARIKALNECMQQELYYGNKGAYYHYEARYAHLVGNKVPEQRNNEVGAYQHEGRRRAHAHRVYDAGGGRYGGAGAENQVEGGVLRDYAV